MAVVSNNQDDFLAKGERYRAAWNILADCEIPPSLEVFEHELEEGRKAHPGLAVEGQARRLAESYHRVQGFFRD